MKKFYSILFTSCVILLVSGSIQAQVFWGLTNSGGASNFGTIFKTDTAGMNPVVKYSFLCTVPGAQVYGDLVQAANGKYYGLTSFGQAAGFGVLFEYDPATSIYTSKLEFSGVANGASPHGSLVLASNQKLYGLTSHGGTNNLGVLFEYDPATNIYTKKFDFSGTTDGALPFGSLVQTSSGKLYGMTSAGGVHNTGVIFNYDPVTSVFSKKLDFDAFVSGSAPNGSLLEVQNGKLYGMTSTGGANNLGVLFEYDTATTVFTDKLDFAGSANGANSMGSVIQTNTGKLYGLTSAGGLNNLGIVFEYDPATSAFTNKIDFDGPTTGANPNGSLLEAANGKLYGMTLNGGTLGNGLIFEFDTLSATCTDKLDFSSVNGANPYGSLIQGVNGKLYGVTYTGGLNRDGVLFEFDPQSLLYSDKVDMNGALDGGIPAGALMLASNGLLYGTATTGGTGGIGVLFSFDTTTSTYTKLVDFNGAGNGFSPRGSLIQATNGKLYGLTTGGGVNDAGVIFEYDPLTSSFAKRMDFDPVSSGLSPQGTLLQATNGKLYGMTYQGGTSNDGTLFDFDLNTSTFTKLLDFDGTNNGANPQGALIQTSTGKLYGLTAGGGTAGLGVLYEFDPATNTYAKKIDLNGTNGASPYGSLFETQNGKLFGLTSAGGTINNGVLFEYDTSNSSYTVRYNFSVGPGGNSPQGSLVQGPNGKLFGTSVNGGSATDEGEIFEYIPSSFSFATKLALTASTTGNYPYGDLLFLCNPIVVHAQPADTSKCEGSAVLFKVSGTGGSTISYQWYDNGNPIAGATTNPYTLSNLKPADAGPVYCDVMNGCSSSNSNTATLTVFALPTVPSISQNITSLVSSATAGNQWYLNGTLIPGATAQSFVVSQNGNYQVVVTNTLGCSSSSAPYNFSDTGIQSNTASGTVSLSPNPANAVLQVSVPAGKALSARLTIFDLLGNNVLDRQETLFPTGTLLPLDISALPEGIYTLRVLTANTQALIKFIKH
jgi:uncharacterized repeat protein (TIGR03803 family)